MMQLFKLLILLRIAEVVESIPAVTGREARYTLTQTDSSHAHIYTYGYC